MVVAPHKKSKKVRSNKQALSDIASGLKALADLSTSWCFTQQTEFFLIRCLAVAKSFAVLILVHHMKVFFLLQRRRKKFFFIYRFLWTCKYFYCHYNSNTLRTKKQRSQNATKAHISISIYLSIYLSYAHPRSLIKSILYSQALRLKRICAETSELSKNLQVLKESFINRGFKEKFLDREFQRLSEIERDALLTPKSKEKDQKKIPFITTYNKTLRNLKQIINKHWHLLQINLNLRTAFEQDPPIAYRRNKNLGDLIGSKKILDDKVVRKNNSKNQLYCRPCLTRRDNICCQQVLKTNTFTSYRTDETFKIFHQLNCRISHLIYLLQCRIYQLQYVGKSGTSFNIRSNKHRKDIKNKNPILACKHLQNSNHNFQRDAKFTLMQQITKSFTTTEQLRLLLKKRENFWILKLKTFYPDGLNQELNDI